jgi:hypothetical protein
MKKIIHLFFLFFTVCAQGQILTNNVLFYEENGLIATDQTKTYSLLNTLDENRYYLNSLLHQNPTNLSVVLHTFGDGTNHVADAGKKISFRKSTDRGETFGSKATLYDPTDGTFQIQDPGIGYDRQGRLHIMADCHSTVGSTGGTHELRYMYSDDDGTTVSSPVTITLPSNGMATFRMYGRIIDMGGGLLLAPCYFFTEEGTTTNSARYALRSTDRGANWSWVLIESGSTYINEMEFLGIDNDIVIGIARYESLPQFWMYKSTDRGATWTSVGVFSTGVALTSATPCRLHKFQLDDGTWTAVMYFVNRGTGTKTLYALYGRLNVGIEAGIGLFKQSSLTTLATNSNIIHYGDVCHYNGNMNARGAWPRETNFPIDNEMIYIQLPATHYTTIYNLIRPSTIYDRLGFPELIVTYRGLVTNTTNSYGVVDGSGNVTTLKSIAPGSTGRDFTATAGGIALSSGIVFDGTKVMTNGASLATWNFLHYSSAGYTDVNYTVYFTAKFGTSSNPNAAFGLFGTNAASSGAKGGSMFYDDRAAVPRNNAFVFHIAKGTVGFIVEVITNDLITPNQDFVGCIEVDLSQATNNNKVKFYINGVLQSTTVSTFNTGVVATPTYSLQLGATGNGALPFTGTIKDFIIQNCIDLPSVRDNMTSSLMALEGL